jgi:hypothetical protein
VKQANELQEDAFASMARHFYPEVWALTNRSLYSSTLTFSFSLLPASLLAIKDQNILNSKKEKKEKN